MHLEAAHAVKIIKLVEYVDRKEDPLIQVVRTHQHTPTQQCYRQLVASCQKYRKKQEKIQDSIAEKTKERWHGKRMHGQLPRNVDEKLVDIEQSYWWLKSGDIKGETECTTEAAQDQAISTNYIFSPLIDFFTCISIHIIIHSHFSAV